LYNGPVTVLQWTSDCFTMDQWLFYNGPVTVLQWTSDCFSLVQTLQAYIKSASNETTHFRGRIFTGKTHGHI